MKLDTKQMQDAFKQTLTACIEANSSLQLYGLFDATCIENLSLNLEIWDIRHANLFQGEEADELDEVSPFLVALDLNDETTDELLQEYGRNSSLYFTSDLEFDLLLLRYRNQFRMYTEYGEAALLRFYDPAIFRHYITLISTERLKVFFDGVSEYFCEGVFPVELERFQLKDGKLYNKTLELPGKQDETTDITLRHDHAIEPDMLFGDSL